MDGGLFLLWFRCDGALRWWPYVERVRNAEASAEAILRHNWPAVRKLSRSLLRRRSMRLTFARVLRLSGRPELPEEW
jgi:hypothetical protein